MRPISPAREYDAPALAALNNRFNAAGLTLPRSEAFVESHLDDYRVIRDDDGHIVGCVCLDEYSPSLVELVSLAVDPDHHRKGLGARLIAAAVDLARKRGYPEIFAVSFSDDLFTRCGFAPKDVGSYPEKKKRYDKVSADEWTVGQKHCFAVSLR
ncbi:MAG: GNAT family N-acetyltransferase [Gemmatimonadaceae bacterium]|nr:GNAT family N-acetyltransferase [Gemmatimonadaceae bacterium]